MKRNLFKFALLFFAALVVCSCEESEIEPENPNVDPEEETTVGEETTVADLQAGNYPTSDIWIITDETIPENAFYGSDGSTLDLGDRQISITYPNAKTVGAYAFYNCTALVEIGLPSATLIGEKAFYECTALKTIDMTSTTASESAESSDVASTKTTETSDATIIEDYAFYGCSSLTAIEMPKVISIGAYAFSECAALATAEISSVTSIGDCVFYACPALSSFEIATDSKLTAIGNDILSSETTPNIDLTIGSENDDVDADAKTWNGYTFKSITVSKTTGEETTVAELQAGNFPTSDYWIITDETIPDYAFYLTYSTLDIGDRQIHITCPNATSIGKCAFQGCNFPTTLEAPNATSIGGYAFNGCLNLTIAKFPNVTSIGYQAFFCCSSLLTTLELPNATTIGGHAFYACSSLLTTLELPNATSIGDYALSNCSALTTVDISAIEDINWGWLNSCYELSTVKTKNATYTAENGIFYNEDKTILHKYLANVSLTEFTAPSSVLEISNNAFGSCTTLESIEIPNATSIGENAFYYCTALESIEIPNATSIGDNAFYNCTSIESIEIPNATSIGDNAFYNCTALESIEILQIETIDWNWFVYCNKLSSIKTKYTTYTTEDGAFYNEDKTTLYKYCGIDGQTEFTAPSSVLEISDYAFYYCTALESIEIPNAASIGDYAFYRCTSLESIEIPNALSIGNWSFSINTTLKSIEIPNATSIGDNAFYNCNALESIEILQIETIDWNWFMCCNKLSSIETKTTTYTAEDGVFYNEDKTTLYKYCGIDGQKKFTAPSSVTEIYAYAFFYCTDLTSIEIPDATTIGDYAFYGCYNAMTISLPSVNSIGKYALGVTFVDDANLEIATKSALRTIGEQLFYNINTTNVNLTIGSENDGVNVDAKTWNGYTFKSITVI